jgi:transposase InsO family protein
MTDLPAHLVAAGPSEPRENGQQRKLSWLGRRRFWFNVLRPAKSANKEIPHEATVGLSEDARPGRHRHRPGTHPPPTHPERRRHDLPRRGRQQPPLYLLIAFIDDASRVLCHGEFFFEENVDTLVQALRAAFYKRGVPEQLLVDNGSIYSCQEITLICARVGCILRHTAVGDAAAKGKIERFFRRVRDQFLIRKLDLSSLEALNRQFTDWVENDYNATLHDALGMKPIDRFGIDLTRVRFLAPSEHSDELFFAEATRKVKKDNTFSFSGRRYETPVDLRDQKIQLRYDRRRQENSVVVVYHKGQRQGAARLLDAVANGLQRRKEQE